MKRHLLFLLVLASSLPALAGKLPYSYFRVGNTSDFDLTTWTGTEGGSYSVSAIKGVLSSTQGDKSPY